MARATRGGRPTCRTRSICCRAAACSRRISITPFCARRGGILVARVSAVINRRYIEHWNEQLGQLIQFEALEDEDVAVAAMIDEAVDRCASAGCARFAAALRRFSIILTRSTITNRCRRFCCAEILRRTIATSRRRASSPKKGRSITPRRSRRKSSRAIAGWPRRPARPASRFKAGASTASWLRSTRGPT